MEWPHLDKTSPPISKLVLQIMHSGGDIWALDIGISTGGMIGSGFMSGEKL